MLHADWRGTIDRASFDNGASTRCKKKTDGTDSTTLCVNPDPAASLLGAYFADPTEDLDANNNLHQPTVWFGNLITQQRDASGLFYKRNRYYDPSSGQFTQEDPLGLAGGLNLYGYAAGDPINFSVPFGLCPIPADGCPTGYWTALGTAAGAIIGGAGDGAVGFLAGF